MYLEVAEGEGSAPGDELLIPAMRLETRLVLLSFLLSKMSVIPEESYALLIPAEDKKRWYR
jgi:hypothetical protein